MKNIAKIGLSTVLSFVFLLQGMSCAKKTEEKDKYEIWSTYATAKVGQSSDNNDDFSVFDAKFDVSLMKNETEGAQILITANSDISEFYLEKAELSDGEKKFPIGNIDVYQQKYIKVTQKGDYNDVYKVGEYVPDMLLPMDTAKEYKENSISAGNNQGLYVEFDSTGVEAGNYTGSFTLTIDGETKQIPVAVTVWDILYEGRRSFQSVFVLYQSTLLRSEYDNSDEMVQNYVDFFLDYKVNILKHNLGRNDFDAYGKEWLKEVVRNKDNLNYNSIYIPYQYPWNFTAMSNNEISDMAKECAKYILGLAKICTPEYCYMDYAYFYPFELDEADEIEERADRAEKMLAEGGEVDQMLEYAVREFKKDGYSEIVASYGKDFADHICESILNLPSLFTNVGFVDNWVENMSGTFCPYLSVFGDGYATDYYSAMAKQKGKKVWTYTCVGPTYPYPTFHLDDYNLGSRISGWMEKYYGIDGYLYWSVSDDFNHSEWYKYVDPYTDPNRWSGADGDGYLVYPGSRYGSDSPFASLRLVAYRDSMDDYDMLCVYENLLTEYYEKYNLGTLSFNDYVEDLYFSLFNNAIYYTDDSLLYAAREELARRILALQNDDGIFLFEKYENNGIEASVYAELPSLTINGTTVRGIKAGDKAYVYSVNTNGVTSIAVKGDSSEVVFALQKITAVQPDSSVVSVTEGSEYTIDGNSVNAILKAKEFNGSPESTKSMNFTPSVSFNIGGMVDAKNICALIENTASGGVNVFVKLEADGMIYELGSMYLTAGETRTARFNLTNGASLTNGGKLHFYIRNVVQNDDNEYELNADAALGISQVRIEYARGK